MQNLSLPLSPEILKTSINILLTLLSAIIINNVLRLFIKVPKSLENRRARTYIFILRKAISVIIYFIALYLILNEIGINITPFLASASIIGIVVGIGARALIEDLINGFFLLTQDSIAIGDYIKLDDAEGNIEKLGFRSLTIRGDSGELHIIPNGLVKKVINYSRHRSYTSIDFPVKSDQDIDLTIKAMREALEEIQKDKTIKDSCFPGSSVLGIVDFKIEGRVIMRTKIITPPEMRFKIARMYRYLTKKKFEKYKIALC